MGSIIPDIGSHLARKSLTMYIVYIQTAGNVRMEIARETGNNFLTTYENARNIVAKHAANYRSNVTISVSTREYGDSEATSKGTKGW